jgi:hypothetical protein
MYHPDVKGYGIGSAMAPHMLARQHYQQAGHKEPRVYNRLQVLLRYVTCGATMQQHYAHIAGLTLAAALGANIVVPPAIVPDTGVHPAIGRPRHQPEPVSSLWDYKHLAR